MFFVDGVILLILAGTVIGGFCRGFFRSVFSLGGLLAGLFLAAWNYNSAAGLILPVVRFQPVADTLGFLLIAFLVMTAADLLGKLLSSTVHGIGMGCLDHLACAVFGFFQGMLLVTLVILVTVAFFPGTHWLTRAHLPHRFFGACHLSTHLSPYELSERVRMGLKTLEKESPGWLHPGGRV